MFSAVDGFRFTGSPAYVALYQQASNNVSALSIDMNNNGNVYLGGSASGSDLLPIIVTDSIGYINKSIALESNPSQTKFIKFDNSNNIFLGGLAVDVTSNNDASLVKLDSNLNIVWQTSFGNSTGNSDNVLCGVLDSSTNIIVGGKIADNVSVIAKYDSSGSLTYSKTLSNVAFITSLAIDNSDNYYAVGWRGTSANIDGITLEKFYANGDFAWGKQYSGTYDSTNQSQVAIDNGGNLYVTVEDQGANSEAYLFMLDSSGTTQWSKYFSNGGSNIITLGSLTCDDSNVYLSTAFGSSGNVVILKIDSAGNTVWERTVSDTYANLGATAGGVGAAVYANNYVAITGQGSLVSNGQQVITVIKIPSDGSQTGVYGNVTYANTNSVTQGNAGLTFTTQTDNSSNITLSTSTPSFTSNTISLTTNITSI